MMMKYPEFEERRRSIVKSVVWRIIGVVLLAGITFLFTRNGLVASKITVAHHFLFVFVYYFHERLWLRVTWPARRKAVVKVITYEVILGNVLLGTITWLFTHSYHLVGVIPITYIANKLWMYYTYERLWLRIRWATDHAESQLPDVVSPTHG